MSNIYWHLKLKEDKQCPVTNKGRKLPERIILEFMPDGMVYMWPVMPDYTNLCKQCKYSAVLNASPEAADGLCKGILPCKVCNFTQAVNTAPEQDLEALIADGDYISFNGSFHNIFDYAANSLCSLDLYDYVRLGEYDSIGTCRSKHLPLAK